MLFPDIKLRFIRSRSAVYPCTHVVRKESRGLGGGGSIRDWPCFGMSGEEHVTYLYTPQTGQVRNECDLDYARQECTISQSCSYVQGMAKGILMLAHRLRA
jgi:hypothetical protein